MQCYLWFFVREKINKKTNASKVKSILFHDGFFDSNVIIKPQILFISGSKVTTISKARRRRPTNKKLILKSNRVWLYLPSGYSLGRVQANKKWPRLWMESCGHLRSSPVIYLFRQLQFDDRSKFDLVENYRGVLEKSSPLVVVTFTFLQLTCCTFAPKLTKET